MRIGIAVGAIVVLLIGFVLFFAYSGVYSVAATHHDGAVTHWFLHTLKDQSIRNHAEDVEVPDLSDGSMVLAGSRAFDEMCVTCHGSPGGARSVIGKGIYPEPPNLSEEAQEWSEAELFWIVKNGIKLAGMPAFGPTHDEKELWQIVAFLKRLPGMSPQEYQALLSRAPASGHAHEGHGSGEHQGGHMQEQGGESGHSHEQEYGH